MKNNRIIWGLVSVVIITTVTISSVTLYSQSQQKSTPDDERAKYKSQFPITDYDAPEPKNIGEPEKRKEKSKRYDNKLFVRKYPHPKTSETSSTDEISIPPAVPVAESEIIIIGEVLNAQAHLSNDKSGIYSEFVIRVEEVIKNNNSHKIDLNSLITADRPGGIVRYENGQQVIYSIMEIRLPLIEGRYVFFLSNAERNLNYNILTGYELKDDTVYPLDKNSRFERFKGMSEINFIKIVREVLAKLSPKSNN